MMALRCNGSGQIIQLMDACCRSSGWNRHDEPDLASRELLHSP
jgi:hypothetical protein